MNRERRIQIATALECIMKAKDIFESVLEAESSAYENLPDSFKESKRGEMMEENISVLEDGISTIEDLEQLKELLN